MNHNNGLTSSPLPHFVQDYINHLAVINKSKNTQYAYTNELRLFFQYLCNSKSAFPSSPVNVSLLHVENIGHRDIEAYLSWASVERNNGVRALARKQAVIKSLYRYLLREDQTDGGTVLLNHNNGLTSSPLPHFVQDYINHLAVINKSKNTQYAYTNELRLFFQYLCNSKSAFPSSPVNVSLLHVENIGHRDIEAYLSWASVERNNGVRALARKQAVIKSLYRYLLREDMISKDVTIKLDPINVNQKLPKALEPNQIADLTDVLQNGVGLSKEQLKYHAYTEKRNYAIFLTFIGTGLRLSELCHLNLTTTNLSKGYFEVIRKGNKETVVYFNSEIKEALDDYLQNERQRYAQGKSEALFLSMQGKRISTRAVQNLITKYMAILKTLGHNTDGFSAHKMRSTFATLLLRETENLAIVQDALGHTDPRTTRIYAKVLDEQLKRSAELIKFR